MMSHSDSHDEIAINYRGKPKNYFMVMVNLCHIIGVTNQKELN